MPEGLEMGVTQFHGNYKTGKESCGDDCGVLILTAGIGVEHYDHSTNQLTTILPYSQMPSLPGSADIARWGNKFYLHFYNPPAQGLPSDIFEYKIDYTACTAALVRTIATPSTGSIGNGMDMVNANTLI